MTNADIGLQGGGITTPTSVADWAAYKSAITDQGDGTYANTPGNVRIVLGQTPMPMPRASTAAMRPATKALRNSGGMHVSAHVPAPASNIQGPLR